MQAQMALKWGMMIRKILVSEDDIAIAVLLQQLFVEEGYEVAVAYSAAHAIRMAAAFRPQVVLIGNDGRGDFEPGWYAAGGLAKLVPDLPMIMLSTSDAALDEFGRTERGQRFAAALLKPFEVEELLNLVHRAAAPTRGAAAPLLHATAT
jgi:DNA-binding response OmpR family regulator